MDPSPVPNEALAPGDDSNLPPTPASPAGVVRVQVQRQVAALEEKLRQQIALATEASDQAMRAANANFIARLEALEDAQSPIQQEVAQLGGSLRGLTEEVHGLSRRSKTGDERAQDSRASLQDELAQRLAEAEAGLAKLRQEVQAASTAQGEASVRHSERIMKMEGTLEDLLGDDDVASSVGTLSRVEALEAVSPELTRAASSVPGLAARLEALEAQVRNAGSKDKAERLLRETLKCQARLEEHEVRSNNIRSRLDAHEEVHRGLGDRLEACNVAGALQRTQEEARRAAQDLTALGQRLEALEKRQGSLLTEARDAAQSRYDQLMMDLSEPGAEQGPVGQDESSPAPTAESPADPQTPKNSNSSLHAAVRREASRVAERTTRSLVREVAVLTQKVGELAAAPRSGSPQLVPRTQNPLGKQQYSVVPAKTAPVPGDQRLEEAIGRLYQCEDVLRSQEAAPPLNFRSTRAPAEQRADRQATTQSGVSAFIRPRVTQEVGNGGNKRGLQGISLGPSVETKDTLNRTILRRVSRDVQEPMKSNQQATYSPSKSGKRELVGLCDSSYLFPDGSGSDE